MWIYTFRTLKPVLLLPRICKGDAGTLVFGFDGRPTKACFGLVGPAVSCSSSGVGGSCTSMLRRDSSSWVLLSSCIPE